MTEQPQKKQSFDDIYIAEDPVPFKERIIDALDYISDNHNRATFNRLIKPWLDKNAERSVNYLDLGCCFGNTTLALANQMSVAEIQENWKTSANAQRAAKPRAFNLKTTGIDISEPATRYGQSSGIFDETLTADLNDMSAPTREAVLSAAREADILVSAAALVYLNLDTIESILDAFAGAKREGYVLVNFLNPFSLEKADATKRLLLERLEFVGSAATRHRRLSALEQENYPGEDWALLEIWVLKRTP